MRTPADVSLLLLLPLLLLYTPLSRRDVVMLGARRQQKTQKYGRKVLWHTHTNKTITIATDDDDDDDDEVNTCASFHTGANVHTPQHIL